METQREIQLSKRLSWLLRHSTAASQKHIQRFKGGFFLFTEALTFLKNYPEAEVRQAIQTSTSKTSSKNRFELQTVGGVEYIRATYGQSFDLTRGKDIPREPVKVSSLEDLCFESILTNIRRFDSFYGMLDNDLLGKFIELLKSRNKITAKTLALVFVPELTTLNLSGTFVSDSALRNICKSCSSLLALNVSAAYTTVTDPVLGMLAKSLSKLEDLNLSGCNRITDAGVKNLTKITTLKYLNLSECTLLTDNSLKVLVQLPVLELLDVRKIPSFTSECAREFLAEKPDALLSDIETPLFYDNNGGLFQAFSTVAEGYPFTLKDKEWPSSHHYYQAMKFEGTEYAESIRLAESARAAHRMGRAEGHVPRPGWDDCRRQVWIEGNLEKFRQNRSLGNLLLRTGDRKLCWNSTDEFWGGRYPHCRNMCGECLMEIRSILRQEELERARVIRENEENLLRTRNGALLGVES